MKWAFKGAGALTAPFIIFLKSLFIQLNRVKENKGQSLVLLYLNSVKPSTLAVAINLIVQHIQDILNGGPSKRHNGCTNGLSTPRQRQTSESSSRPHWPHLTPLNGAERCPAVNKATWHHYLREDVKESLKMPCVMTIDPFHCICKCGFEFLFGGQSSYLRPMG